MNWYRKSQTQLDWNHINDNLDYHIQMILEGKKPAGDFSRNEYGDDYSRVLETVDYVKATRPDLRVVHYLHRDGYIEGHIIGKPNAVQSIMDGMRRVYEGRELTKGHRMWGEGTGHSKEEIDDFMNRLQSSGVLNYPDKAEPTTPIIEFNEV